MARPPDPDRKPALLDQVVEWLCDHGIGALSLRPLATDLGVSTFVLTYHFGSKELLLVEALERVEDEHRLLVATLDHAHPEATLREALWRYWSAMTSDEPARKLRLVLEAATLSATETGLPGDVRARLVTSWVDDVATVLRASGLDDPAALALATLVIDALTGLYLDLVVSGDRDRVEAGLALLCELVDRAPDRSDARP